MDQNVNYEYWLQSINEMEESQLIEVLRNESKYEDMYVDLVKERLTNAFGYDETKIQEAVENTWQVALPETKPTIHGWLSFFLFQVVAGGSFSLIYTIVKWNPEEYDGSAFLSTMDILFVAMYFGLSILTFYAFCKRHADAVYLGRIYMIGLVVLNLFSLMLSGMETEPSPISNTVRSVSWAFMWIMYLSFSKQVKEIIPIQERKWLKRDTWIVVAFFMIPIISIIGVIAEEGVKTAKQASLIIDPEDLGKNEYTDGIISFTKPLGFLCAEHKNEEGQIAVYRLEDEADDHRSITIGGFISSEKLTQSVFDECCDSWKYGDLEHFTSHILADSTKIVNGCPIFYRRIKYDTPTPEPISWLYAIIYNESLNKACIISAYNCSDEFLEDFMKSIKFDN